MFRTLRSQLLLSYVLVTSTVLLLVAVALLFLSMAPATARLRILPVLQQLQTVSISAQRQIEPLARDGITLGELEPLLDEIAEVHNIRILLGHPRRRTFVYDSEKTASWEGQPVGNIEQFRQFFREVSPSIPAGRLVGPDGKRWLVHAQFVPVTDLGRAQILLAMPESSGFAFFRNHFLPLLWRAGLVALFLSIFLAFFISRSVAKPLQHLITAAGAVAAGNYEQHVPVDGPEDVQRVAQSFNSMVARVKATQEAQRDFLANVSHDLKTPLTAIQGWSQALRDGTVNNADKQDMAADIIHEEAQRMTRMVQELLTLARIDSGQLQLNREWVNAGEILADVTRNLSWLAEEKQIELAFEQEAAPPVWADADRLMQVFTNLVDNALTHTPSGGRVQLTLQVDGAKWIRVLVRDSGRGIPPSELPRIFERFYRVEKSRARVTGQQGFGLGLTIVRELVEAHGGQITVRSEPDNGSLFTVKLPLNENAPTQNPLASPDPPND